MIAQCYNPDTTYEERTANLDSLGEIVLSKIVPMLDRAIIDYGVKIQGTYNHSPYTWFGKGKLFLMTRSLLRVKALLHLIGSRLRIRGVISEFHIERTMDGLNFHFTF